ncbi:MAG: metal-dependent hydrolase [Natrialbaceae archaeon]|nr:metal-dependent hydrolase [Natrialbaceae archaeon]
MNRDGHYGVALLVYCPRRLCAGAIGIQPACGRGGIALLVLVMVPDWDLYVPLLPHRGPTHSVTFALLVGLAVGIGVAYGIREGLLGPLTASADPLSLVLGGVFIGSFSVVSHLLGDVLTPMGIRPLWPLSSYYISFDITRAANPISNKLLLAAGIGAAGLATALLVA